MSLWNRIKSLTNSQAENGAESVATLLDLAGRIQERFWRQYGRKFQQSFIAENLLSGRMVHQAISYGRKVLNGKKEPGQLFFEVLVAHEHWPADRCQCEPGQSCLRFDCEGMLTEYGENDE